MFKMISMSIRSNKEDFVEKANKKYDNFYSYLKSEYITSLDKITITCPIHGDFEQTPKSHLRSRHGCQKCARESQIEFAKKQQEDFIKEATMFSVNGDTFNLVEYVNNKTDVEIICPVHGSFKVRPDLYLRGRGCKKCLKKKTKSNDKDIFIEEATKLYGDLHDYSETKVISSKENIEVRCKKHDYTFSLNIFSYLRGQNCPKCSQENYSKLRIKPIKKYIEQAEKVWKGEFDYTDSVYKGHSTYIDIKCKKHGIFRVLPNNHLKGQGCSSCRHENTGYKGNRHHTKEGYIKLAKDRLTYLYVIRCWNKSEKFYKIGKTFRGLDKRFTKSNMPYEYETVFLVEGKADYIWDLEENLHKKYKKLKYKVLEMFNGYSECYSLKLPIKEIKEYERICR